MVRIRFSVRFIIIHEMIIMMMKSVEFKSTVPSENSTEKKHGIRYRCQYNTETESKISIFFRCLNFFK